MEEETKYPILGRMKDQSSRAFSLPEGYFISLPETIQTKIAIGTLGENSTNNPYHPYKIPDDYFSDLPDKISKRIGIISKASAEPKVPKNYFENLNSRIFQRILEEEHATPLLDSIKKEKPFSLPTSYFEELNEKVSEKIKEDEIPVISIFKERKIHIAWRWAAIGLILLVTSWFLRQSFKQSGPSERSIIAEVMNEPFDNLVAQELDEQIILEYLGNENRDGNKKSISEEEVLQNVDMGAMLDAL